MSAVLLDPRCGGPAAYRWKVPEGVFLASTHRFVFDVTGPPGSGERVVATRFYLLSATGRFHRGWGLRSLPEGGIGSFDFAAMEPDAPYNTGSYTVDGDAVVLAPVAGETEQGVLDHDVLLIEQLRFEFATPGAS